MHELLGLTPDNGALNGTGLRIRWLCNKFEPGSPPYATEDVVLNFV